MTILKKIHLDRGMVKNTKDIYYKHISSLDTLSLDDLKKFLGIYSTVIEQIDAEFQLREDKEFSSIKEQFLFEDSSYKRNKKYRNFLRYRMREDNLEQFIGQRWLDSLETTKVELKEYTIFELMDCSVKAFTLLQIIDTFITQREPLWSPYSLQSIQLLEITNFDFSV